MGELKYNILLLPNQHNFANQNYGLYAEMLRIFHKIFTIYLCCTQRHFNGQPTHCSDLDLNDQTTGASSDNGLLIFFFEMKMKK